MPIYQYACELCAEVTEELQKFSDTPIKDCPKCGGNNSLVKMISLPSKPIFKGTGFYATDYPKKK